MPTAISSLGEFPLIERLTALSSKHSNPSTLLGVGDDAAILSLNEAEDSLVTTDMLLEGIHFDLTYMPLKHLGYKAVAVNVSDICAMNGIATQITLSVGISSKFSVENLDELYEGVYAACQEYHVDLVGGDTCASVNGLTLSITCLGRVPKGEAVLRSTAQAEDVLFVTGNVGAAYMGYLLLEREKRIFAQQQDRHFTPDFAGYEYLVERQLTPHAQQGLRHLLAERNVHPTSMIDISDGLSSELLHIAHRSNKGIRIYEDQIPIDHQTMALCEQMQINPITAALNGGEDYEILFSIPLTEIDRLHNTPGVTPIGYVSNDPAERVIITHGGQAIELKAQGWNAAEHL